MIKAVFDTNIFISAFGIPKSKAETAYKLAANGKINLYTSPAILTETAGKFRNKFNISEGTVTRILKQISKTAEVIRPTFKLSIVSDEPDNRVLECAVAARADLIVTGDKHLLELKIYEGIGIIRTADLLYIVRNK